jgi:hypothetical protein
MDFVFTLALSIVIVVLTILVNYEVLNIVWKHIPKIEKSPRKCIVYIMLAILAGHTFAVWIYGFGYLMIAEIFYKEALIEQGFDGFIQYLFASAQIYSSFGGAELFSLGTMRFLASIEALNGIVMVAWTFSLTYVVIDKTWQLPRQQKKLEQLKIEFKESKK